MILHGYYENGNIEIVEKDKLNKLPKKKFEIDIYFYEGTKNIKKHNVRGVLKKYKNVNLIKKEKLGWELSVKDKHGNS